MIMHIIVYRSYGFRNHNYRIFYLEYQVIHRRLDELLAEREMSLYKLAKETGLTEVGLRNLRNEKTKGITFELLEKVCRALNCTPNDLLVLVDDAKANDIKSNNSSEETIK